MEVNKVLLYPLHNVEVNTLLNKVEGGLWFYFPSQVYTFQVSSEDKA